MKKFIIVTLMAGFLTAQAPVNARNTPNCKALAQAAKAQNILAAGGQLHKTSGLRKLAYTALSVGGIAGLTYLAFTLGFTPDYLMSLIPTDYLMSFINAAPAVTEPVVIEAVPSAFDVCYEGFVNLGSGCVDAVTNTCEDMPGVFDGVLGRVTNGILDTATNTCSYVWKTANFIPNDPFTCADGFVQGTGDAINTCVEVVQEVVQEAPSLSWWEILKQGTTGAFGVRN